MRGRWICGVVALVAVLGMMGCEEGGPYAPADLAGTWKFRDNDSDKGSWESATITFDGEGNLVGWTGPDSRTAPKSGEGQLTVTEDGSVTGTLTLSYSETTTEYIGAGRRIQRTWDYTDTWTVSCSFRSKKDIRGTIGASGTGSMSAAGVTGNSNRSYTLEVRWKK